MALAQPLVAAAAALALVSAASAAGPIVRKNAADDAVARDIVLKRTDLGGAGWKGSVKAVARPQPLSCPPFSPDQSGLVVTGAASSEWQRQALSVSSEAEVLQTAAMVRRDWSRTVRPTLVRCLGKVFVSNRAGTTTTAVSVRKIGFAKVAPMTAAYRIVVTIEGSGGTARVVFDLVLLGKGRSEATLTFVTPQAGQAAMAAIEPRIARIVAGRLRS